MLDEVGSKCQRRRRKRLLLGGRGSERKELRIRSSRGKRRLRIRLESPDRGRYKIDPGRFWRRDRNNSRSLRQCRGRCYSGSVSLNSSLGGLSLLLKTGFHSRLPISLSIVHEPIRELLEFDPCVLHDFGLFLFRRVRVGNVLGGHHPSLEVFYSLAR